MNESINKIIAYFEAQDNKSIIMLILSVIIVCGIAIFYLNDFFNQKTKILENEKSKIFKKLNEVRTLNANLGKLKHQNKLLKTKFQNLNSDLRFLISEIEVSKTLNTDKDKFLTILHKYLKIGTTINSSFEISNNLNNLAKYNLYIKGNFNPGMFFNFVEFIKILQSPKAIITINSLKAQKNNELINYDMNVTIWSFK